MTRLLQTVIRKAPGFTGYSICVVKAFGIKGSGSYTVDRLPRGHKSGRGRDVRRDHGQVLPAGTRSYDTGGISWECAGNRVSPASPPQADGPVTRFASIH